MTTKTYATVQMVKETANIANTDTTQDARIKNLLDRTTKMIERYLGRSLFSATYTEYHDGDGETCELRVKNWPIVSVTTLHDDAAREYGSDSLLTESTDYEIVNGSDVDNEGIVRLLDGRRFAASHSGTKIVYVGGYSDANMPADLKQAQADWIASMLAHGPETERMKSLKLGDYAVTFRDAADGQRYAMPVAVKDVLDWYRDVRFESTEGVTGIQGSDGL